MLKIYKTSEQYRSVYIQRDLTYRQRQELFHRKATSDRSGGQLFHDNRDVVDSVGVGGVAFSDATALAPRRDIVCHGYYPSNRGRVQRGRVLVLLCVRLYLLHPLLLEDLDWDVVVKEESAEMRFMVMLVFRFSDLGR